MKEWKKESKRRDGDERRIERHWISFWLTSLQDPQLRASPSSISWGPWMSFKIHHPSLEGLPCLAVPFCQQILSHSVWRAEYFPSSGKASELCAYCSNDIHFYSWLLILHSRCDFGMCLIDQRRRSWRKQWIEIRTSWRPPLKAKQTLFWAF